MVVVVVELLLLLLLVLLLAVLPEVLLVPELLVLPLVPVWDPPSPLGMLYGAVTPPGCPQLDGFIGRIFGFGGNGGGPFWFWSPPAGAG